MPAYTNAKRIFKYSDEFKMKAVQWSFDPQRSVKDVAAALDIHPFMLSRWRKEFREGKYGPMKPTTNLLSPMPSSKSRMSLKNSENVLLNLKRKTTS